MIPDLAIPHCNHLKVLCICVSAITWMHILLSYFPKTVLLLGNDPTDEDVDICGNDPPVSSYPHVKVEKETNFRMNKSPSPSSSSGMLGSEFLYDALDNLSNLLPWFFMSAKILSYDLFGT